MTTNESYTDHHGLLLKQFILNNGVNRKGGLNKLSEVLGISRQAIYLLYEQREIKEKHRLVLIEHLNLPENFFPNSASTDLGNNKYIVELQKRFIQTQEELLNAERKLNHLSYAPKLLPVIIDANNNDKVALVPRKAVAGYTKNLTDIKYLSKLQTFSFPNCSGGFAFEIEGDSMNPSKIEHGDYVICEELIEQIENVKAKQPYIVVLNNGDIVCKLIKAEQNSLSLISTNKEYLPYSITLNKVIQIWKIKSIFTSNLP